MNILTVSILTRHEHPGRAARLLAAAARKGLRALPDHDQSIMRQLITNPRVKPVLGCVLAALLLTSLGGAVLSAQESTSPGLSVREGHFILNGQPYRGVGANYFDLFRRVLHKPDDTSSLAGLHQLAQAGIPFVRFALAFDNRDWELYFKDRAEFFRRLDIIVRAAEREKVGLIPSFFWSFMGLPDRVGETRDQWGNPDSKTSAQMREIVAAFIERYKDSSALWGYEFGNEPNLIADLPNAAQFRKKGGTERDDMHAVQMTTMLAEFAREIRRHDTHRAIFSGNSHPRASSWHNTAEKSWKSDSREQTMEIIQRDNPAPLDTVSIHLYADHPVQKECAAWATNHVQYLAPVMELARGLKRPVWIGEFGLADQKDPAETRAMFGRLLTDMEQAGVDLAAFWVFDLGNQKTWTVTPDNGRAYMLKLAAEANRRWAQSKREPAYLN